MRVVFDTVVLVRGLINPRSPCGRLVFECAADCEVVVSPEIVREYVDVLQRTEIARKFREAGCRNLHGVLDIIAEATVVEPAQTPTVCRDPGDDKFLAAALAGNVSVIISEDHDLLALGSYAGIPIVTATAMLHRFARGCGKAG